MIFVECDPDFALLEELMLSGIEHAGGKGRVCSILRRRAKNSIGVVDEDPGRTQPSYLKNLPITQNLDQHGLELRYDNARNNCIVLICPKLEDWILSAARIAKVDVKEYNLPDDPDELHEVVNFNLEKFRKLVRDLANTARLQALKSLILR